MWFLSSPVQLGEYKWAVCCIILKQGLNWCLVQPVHVLGSVFLWGIRRLERFKFNMHTTCRSLTQLIWARPQSNYSQNQCIGVIIKASHNRRMWSAVQVNGFRDAAGQKLSDVLRWTEAAAKTSSSYRTSNILRRRKANVRFVWNVLAFHLCFQQPLPFLWKYSFYNHWAAGLNTVSCCGIL